MSEQPTIRRSALREHIEKTRHAYWGKGGKAELTEQILTFLHEQGVRVVDDDWEPRPLEVQPAPAGSTDRTAREIPADELADDPEPAVPPITETGRRLVAIDPAELERLRARDETHRRNLLAALGMDPLRDWDDIVNAAKCLMKERARLRTRLAVHEHYRALGGPPPAITEQWERGTVSRPASASDETAPPHERGR